MKKNAMRNRSEKQIFAIILSEHFEGNTITIFNIQKNGINPI